MRERSYGERRAGVVGDSHFEEAKALYVEPVGEVERRDKLGLAAGEAVLRREQPERGPGEVVSRGPADEALVKRYRLDVRLPAQPDGADYRLGHDGDL